MSAGKSRPRKQRRRAVVRAGDLVADVLRSAGAMEAVREHRLVTRWSEVVGERVAARAWPDGLKNGVLYVRVANASWMQELSFLREALADKANRLVGEGGSPLVRSVRLHVEERRDADGDDVIAALAARRRPKPTPRPRAPVDAISRARIAAETAKVGDSELREIIRTLRDRLGM